MQIIPVIDVRHGVAVRAAAGNRAAYRPLETPLAPSSDPVAVAHGYLALYPFPAIYVADLDGIEGRGADLATQHRLAQSWSGEVWIDDGMASIAAKVPQHVAVVGSESLDAMAKLPARDPRTWVLSLDFRDEVFQGPDVVLEDEGAWPSRIIVMTLARVGMNEGPDLARVRSIVARAGARAVYAAGGVRNAGDLRALRDAGAAGALVASALHSGQIKTGDLEKIAGV